MNPILKKILASLGVILLAFIAYYGSYLPMRKSQIYISTVRSMGGARSVDEFIKLFDIPFNIPSPIGQEELVRNLTTEITGFVSRGASAVEVEKDLVAYAERRFEPIIARGRGMSFEQNLYILGTLHLIMFQHTKDINELNVSERYFTKGLELGPRRPQFLYGMFDVKRMRGDLLGAKETVEKIISLWPADARMKMYLSELDRAIVSSTKAQAGLQSKSKAKPKKK